MKNERPKIDRKQDLLEACAAAKIQLNGIKASILAVEALQRDNGIFLVAMDEAELIKMNEVATNLLYHVEARMTGRAIKG